MQSLLNSHLSIPWVGSTIIEFGPYEWTWFFSFAINGMYLSQKTKHVWQLTTKKTPIYAPYTNYSSSVINSDSSSVEKLGQFAMPETGEIWLGIVNSCVYCARQTREIYQVLPYLVDLKAPGELWNPLSKTVYSK